MAIKVNKGNVWRGESFSDLEEPITGNVEEMGLNTPSNPNPILPAQQFQIPTLPAASSPQEAALTRGATAQPQTQGTESGFMQAMQDPGVKSQFSGASAATSVGLIIGAVMGGPVGAVIGGAVGSLAGGIYDFFAGKSAAEKQTKENKRVENIRMRYFTQQQEKESRAEAEAKRDKAYNKAKTEEELRYKRMLDITGGMMNMFASRPALSSKMINLWRARRAA